MNGMDDIWGVKATISDLLAADHIDSVN